MSDKQSRPTVAVNVFDSRFFHKQIAVSGQQGEFKLTLDPSLKTGQYFGMALLLDECAFSRRLLFQYPRDQRVAVLQESPLLGFYQKSAFLKQHYDVVFTFHHELLALGEPFYRLDIGGSWLNAPIKVGIDQKSELVSFMGSVQHTDIGGYALRKQVAAHMLQDQRVECFGRGINEIEHKADALAPFQFSIAMENCVANYYYTEKLIDCFMAETVPIYWGCPAITDIFDPRGMLLFTSVDQLSDLLDRISPELYMAMRPYVLANRERALQLGLTSYQGFYSRLLEQLGAISAPMLAASSGHSEARRRVSQSSMATGLRYGLEYLKGFSK